MNPTFGPCARPGCTGSARPVGHGLCEKHRLAARKVQRPADLPRQVLQRLIDQDYTAQAIGRAAGIRPQTVRRILAGQPTVTTPVWDKIMALHTDPVRPVDGYEPALPIVRRVRALAAAGHETKVITAATRLGYNTVAQIRQGRRGLLLRTTTAEALRTVYGELSAKPVTGRRFRCAPAWRPPFDWDSGELDALPEHWWRAIDAGHQSAEWRLAVIWQRIAATTWTEVAHHLEVPDYAVHDLISGRNPVTGLRARLEDAA